VLRLYTSYVNDFPEVLKTFHKLCRSSADFTQFLKACLEQPVCGGLDLGAFLLTPVQRMPRYILLLKQLIKYTEAGHGDYQNITICLDRLRIYLKQLNDSMEHSFQLVTAQITPANESQNDNHHHSQGFLQKRGFTRTSFSSHSNTSGKGRDVENGSKTRYKRSISIPRNETQQKDYSKADIHKSSKELCKTKLKSRSKSDWAVCSSDKSRSRKEDSIRGCNACKCASESGKTTAISKLNGTTMPRKKGTKKPYLQRAVSDSDMSSDEDLSEIRYKFIASKSLHDFHNNEKDGNSDWAVSEPSLCNRETNEKTNGGVTESSATTVRNKIMVRPMASAQPGRYVARIQRGNESGPGIEKAVEKKRMSLKSSLKNLFSLKKRYGAKHEQSSNTAFRVVYAENKHIALSSSSTHLSPSFGSNSTSDLKNIGISPLMQYLHRMPSYLELIMFSVRETTV